MTILLNDSIILSPDRREAACEQLLQTGNTLRRAYGYKDIIQPKPMVWRRIRVKDATGGVLHPQDGGPGLSSNLKLSYTPSHGTAGIVQGELLHAELQLSAAGHNIQIITDHRLHQQCSHLLTTDPVG